ncbi:hypothetical protein N0V93_008679 [Gnomoniopsis smithogilvyi]|uniref:Uncharacterized protein n=1 Tax=Gnomoniopsis smithogilvyi TaxID=1191159 RepID=A0A9W8YM60_9PEZI|nr:hypothetical protein N0V93_008679 [Gnomoniopsis smithogilvyi]
MESRDSDQVAPGPHFPLNLRAFDSAPTYNTGDTFNWILEDGYDTSVFPNPELNVRIEHVFGPFTCSPVMRVSYDTKNGPRTAILKTYDRRHGTISRLRPRGTDLIEYDPSSDEELIRIVHEGKAEQLMRDFTDENFGGGKRRPLVLSGATNNELFFQVLRLEEFEHEVAAYEVMSHLQGDCIPRFLAELTWRPNCANGELLKIGAILIEEVENAVTVADFLEEHSPQNRHSERTKPITDSLLNKIIDEKGRIERLMEDCGVRDPDRHLGNALIVINDLEKEDFRLVHIDFGFTRIVDLVEDERQTEDGALENEIHAVGEPAAVPFEMGPDTEVESVEDTFEAYMDATGMTQELPFGYYGNVASSMEQVNMGERYAGELFHGNSMFMNGGEMSHGLTLGHYHDAEREPQNDHDAEREFEEEPPEQHLDAEGEPQTNPDAEWEFEDEPSEDGLDAEGEPEERPLDADVEIYDAEDHLQREREALPGDGDMEPAPIEMPAGTGDEKHIRSNLTKLNSSRLYHRRRLLYERARRTRQFSIGH